MNTDKLSWSQVSLMSNCNRAWWLKYNKNIIADRQSNNFPMLLGKAFHEAMVTEILYRNYSGGLENYLERGEVLPEMVVRIENTIDAMFSFYLTDIREYLYGTNLEVFHIGGLPCVEYEFETEYYKGIVDVILIDKITNELVLVDYKLRSRIDLNKSKSVHGQLPLYAALLSTLPEFKDYNISAYHYLELNYNLPKPARVSKVSGKLSTAVQHTTWDYWLETLPANMAIDIEEWQHKLEGKLKHSNEFFNLDVNYLDAQEIKYILSVSNEFVAHRDRLNVTDIPMATLSNHICRMCEFSPICASNYFISDRHIDGFLGHGFQKR